MSVPPRILCAAGRWLRLLKQGPYAQARSFLSNDVRYSDLSRDQYSRGLDLLIQFEFYSLDFGLDEDLLNSHVNEAMTRLAVQALIFNAPVWFDDPLIEDAIVDPPSEVMSIMDSLELTEDRAPGVIRRAFRKVDLERRSEIGAAGESELIRLLELAGVESVTQVSCYDDGAGYDLLVFDGGSEFHFEVKATTKRRAVTFFLSRNEYETSVLDPNWKLVVVGLDSEMRIADLVSVERQALCGSVPIDRSPLGKWESAQLQFSVDSLSGCLVIGSKPIWSGPAERWWG